MNEQQKHEPSSSASLSAHVGRIAGVLSSKDFPTGERAALRRMNPGQPPPLSFYRFALRHLPEGWERHKDNWSVIVAGIALMAPSAHRPGRGLGQALAETGFAETRLERLLASRGETRATLLLRAARFLAAKAAPFDWTEGARLLLIRDISQLEELHRHIARDYYRELQIKTG